MARCAVVYWSGTGNTQSMADCVAEGIISAGKDADVFAAADFASSQAEKYEGFAFGCPSMGAETLEESEFAPMYESVKPLLKGKCVVLFGSYGWGDGEWMRTWEADCRESGCVMADAPVIANGAPDASASEQCRALGAALANS